MVNKRKKIVFVITRADIGGAQNHVQQLLTAFHENFQCVLIVGSSGPLVDAVKMLDVPVYIVPVLNRKTFLPALFRLCSILRSERPDLLHVHSAIAGFVGRVAAKVLGIKTVYTVHGWHFINNSSLLWRTLGVFLERRARALTDHWLLLTLYDQNQGVSERVIDLDRTHIVVNGLPDFYADKTSLKKTLDSSLSVDAKNVGLSNFEPNDVGSNRVLKVAFIGRATLQKNCLEAIHIIEKCQDNIVLTLFSAIGAQTALIKNHLQSSVAAKRIKLIENQSNAAEQLVDFDVLLLTSKHEGMPLVVLEAMRVGLPVVATDVCGLSELVLNHESGFLYPLGDVGQAVQYLQKLAQDSALRREYGRNGRVAFEKNYSEQMMLEKVAAVYQQVLTA